MSDAPVPHQSNPLFTPDGETIERAEKLLPLEGLSGGEPAIDWRGVDAGRDSNDNPAPKAARRTRDSVRGGAKVDDAFFKRAADFRRRVNGR